jgi:DNA-binding NtrC family response regulator
MRILIVDDETGIRNSINELLKDRFETFTAEDGEQAFKLFSEKSFDIVISDFKMPKMSGLELLAKIREISPLTGFILMTAYGSIDGAVKAIQAGVDDYISKPIEFTELNHKIEQIQNLYAWKQQKNLKENYSKKTQLIGSSQFIVNLKDFIHKVAAVQSPVLLLGPSGTGKEVVSKSIHESGPFAQNSFVAINCASLSENLIESELFGHEKGSFTGASQTKIGKFELAAGGTIFLDEIGELPMPLQAKLLRVLQEKEFCRIGGTRQIKSTARVIAATHRNLKEWVSLGLFREDLYFRLNVIQNEMIPLKNRKQDVAELIQHYWAAISDDLGMRSLLTPAARVCLENYSYPGNVRELKNIIERLIVLSPENGRVDVFHLPKEITQSTADTNDNTVQIHLPELNKNAEEIQPASWKPGLHLDSYLEQIEQTIVTKAFDICQQNQVQTAELLGINRGTLQYKIKRFELGKKKAA